MQSGVICLDSFLDVVAQVLLGILILGITVFWVAADPHYSIRKVRPYDSDEELYRSDNDPATTGDLPQARDPGSLPPGRAYGDNYRAPLWLRLAVPSVVAGSFAIYFVWRFLSEDGLELELWQVIASVAFLTIGFLVLGYLLGDDKKQGGKVRGEQRNRSQEHAGLSAKKHIAGEKPSAKRKRTYRRQL
jgi:hypothetical protein